MICLGSADLQKARSAGKVAMMLDCQNGFYIGNQLDSIDEAYGHGIRRTQLAYNRGGGPSVGTLWGIRTNEPRPSDCPFDPRVVGSSPSRPTR